MHINDAVAELAQLEDRAATLRRYIAAEKTRMRHQAFELGSRCEPCSWCGSTESTQPERHGDFRTGRATGRFICRHYKPSGCRAARVCGDSPEQYRATRDAASTVAPLVSGGAA